MPERVAIFIGVFDPIHNGHLALARKVLSLGTKKVFLLVEPRPKRKQGVRALKHRNEMVRLAISTEPHLGLVKTNRARLTFRETLPVLVARFKGCQLVLVIDQESFPYLIEHLGDWPKLKSFDKVLSLIIVARKNQKADLLKQIKLLNDYQFSFDCQLIDAAQPIIDSEQLRLELKHHRKITELPEPVLKYIKAHRLYASTAIAPK